MKCRINNKEGKLIILAHNGFESKYMEEYHNMIVDITINTLTKNMIGVKWCQPEIGDTVRIIKVNDTSRDYNDIKDALINRVGQVMRKSDRFNASFIVSIDSKEYDLHEETLVTL